MDEELLKKLGWSDELIDAVRRSARDLPDPVTLERLAQAELNIDSVATSSNVLDVAGLPAASVTLRVS